MNSVVRRFGRRSVLLLAGSFLCLELSVSLLTVLLLYAGGVL